MSMNMNNKMLSSVAYEVPEETVRAYNTWLKENNVAYTNDDSDYRLMVFHEN